MLCRPRKYMYEVLLHVGIYVRFRLSNSIWVKVYGDRVDKNVRRNREAEEDKNIRRDREVEELQSYIMFCFKSRVATLCL